MLKKINVAKRKTKTKQNQKKNNPLDRVTYLSAFRYLPLSWKDSAAFPVWCCFSCRGNLRSWADSWQRRKEADKTEACRALRWWLSWRKKKNWTLYLAEIFFAYRCWELYFEAAASWLKDLSGVYDAGLMFWWRCGCFSLISFFLITSKHTRI